jgi:hypothetical protein
MLDTYWLYNELKQTMDTRAAETLVQILGWMYEDLRNTVTKAEFRELKNVVRDLAEAQKRTEQRVERLEVVVAELAEAQKRNTQMLYELIAAQKRTEERVGRLENRLAQVDGRTLEHEYRDKTIAYFGHLLRKAGMVPWNRLEDILEPRLSAEELRDVFLTDLVVGGRPRAKPELGETWLAVEVSAMVDAEDVVRALRRAALLRKAGCPVIPVAAGQRATEGAEELAQMEKVMLLQDGRYTGWDEALASWGVPSTVS